MICMVLTIASHAQQTKPKWKAPHRTIPKWVSPKRENEEEVLELWRPYGVSDNWFVDFNVGTSVPFSENMEFGDAFKQYRPVFDFGVGKQFSYLWSTKFNVGYKQTFGKICDDADVNEIVDYYGNEYLFKMCVISINEQIDLTNLLCPYKENRKFGVQAFAGVGVNYAWGFPKKMKNLIREGYEFDNRDHVNLDLCLGAQCLYKLSRAVDASLRVSANLIGDNHNGLTHGTFADPYVFAGLGVVVHLQDHYGDYRYKKVHRWEAKSLRTQHASIAKYLNDEKKAELKSREESEVVRIGELMKTHVSFYVDRFYVNDEQLENLRIVADFLKDNPDVNVIIKGYSGASDNCESPVMHLAQKRVDAVKKRLIRNLKVDSSRIETWYDEEAKAPFEMKGEWIDAVVFEMTRR